MNPFHGKSHSWKQLLTFFKIIWSHTSRIYCSWLFSADQVTLPQIGAKDTSQEPNIVRSGLFDSLWQALRFILLLLRLYAIKKPWFGNNFHLQNFWWMWLEAIFDESDQNAVSMNVTFRGILKKIKQWSLLINTSPVLHIFYVLIAARLWFASLYP